MSRARAGTAIAWGGADQALSSATNLGLSILAGRLLGASGLGTIFVGFTAYLFALSLMRGLITAPFVVESTVVSPEERERSARRCIMLVLCAAVVVTASMFVLGSILPDPLGRGLLLFSPVVGVALIQDQWRSILFRDGRGGAAALNDGVWLAAMVVLVPFAYAFPNEWCVTLTWGIGAAAGALLGCWQVRLRPTGPTEAWSWWNREVRRLGTWLALESILIAAGAQLTIIILTAILSTSDLGGIRVVQVVFAPMTLVNEAFTFPGVPIMARALAVSLANARRSAWRLGFGALACVGVYLAFVCPFSSQILTNVFGPEFSTFSSLVLPTALGQLPLALATGFLILMKADRRGHAIVVAMAVRTAVTLILTPILAVQFGVLGAVWGLTLGAFAGGTATIYFGLLTRDIALVPSQRTLATESS